MTLRFTKLTKDEMKKLSPGEEIREHGIVFVREKNGDGLFKAELMVYGERIHRVIGRGSDGTTRTQANESVEQMKSDAKSGRQSLPRGRKIALSFKDAAIEYIAKLKAEGGKDIVMKESRLKLHLIPFFGAIRLDKISASDIARYKHLRTSEKSLRGGDRVSKREHVVSENAKNTSKGTVNRELAALSHLLTQAVEWKWITHMPVKIDRFSEGDGRKFYLTIEETQRFVKASMSSSNQHLYPFVLIAIETTMRLNEILRIKKEHVNLSKRIIHIPDAKGGPRDQPITKRLAKFLAPYVNNAEGVEWIFPSPGSITGHAVDIRKPWVRAVKEAGLDPRLVLRHTLRHTAITHLVQAGVDLPTVQRISGHKSLAMVAKYAHQNGDHIAKAMDRFQKRTAAWA